MHPYEFEQKYMPDFSGANEMYLHLGNDWIVFKDIVPTAVNLDEWSPLTPAKKPKKYMAKTVFYYDTAEVLYDPSAAPVSVDEWKTLMEIGGTP